MLHAKPCLDDDIHCICVRPTGDGKSLLFTALSICLGNVTLVITPLLSLGTDQTIKHQHSTLGVRNTLNSADLDKISNDTGMKLTITEMERSINIFSTISCASLQSFVTEEGSSSLSLSFILQNPTFASMIVIDEIYLMSEFSDHSRNSSRY